MTTATTTVCTSSYLVHALCYRFLSIVSYIIVFLTGFDLNLSLDEYGAVDFDFVENLTGT